MGRLSNNQINELALYEEMVRKLNELEQEEGTDLIHARWSETHNTVSMSIPARIKNRTVPRALKVIKYTVGLEVRTAPLRVTWQVGDGPAGVKSFRITRQCLLHVISQIDMYLSYQRTVNAVQIEVAVCDAVVREILGEGKKNPPPPRRASQLVLTAAKQHPWGLDS